MDTRNGRYQAWEKVVARNKAQHGLIRVVGVVDAFDIETHYATSELERFSESRDLKNLSHNDNGPSPSHIKVQV